MGHVYNGDMFTTTVLAGLMNTFVSFIAIWVRRFFAEAAQTLEDTDYGSRGFTARDPEGNLWSFGTYRPGDGA